MAIAYSQIGTLYFITLEGTLDPKGQEIEEITEPYEDGVAFRKTAIRGEKTRLRTVSLCADASAAKTHIEAMKAFQGTLKTIVRRSQSWANMTIIRVGDFIERDITTANGGVLPDNSDATGVATIAVEAEWLVQYGST